MMNRVHAKIFLGGAIVLIAWTLGSSVPTAEAAFPQVVGSQLSSRASAEIDDSVTLPASVASGDLIIVFHYSDSGLTRTFPSPWVEIKDAACSGPSCNIGVGYLIASGGETSVTVTKSGAERFSAIAVRISAASWHGVTPPEISTGASGSSANPGPDAVTASWGSADNLFIAAMAWDDSDGGDTVSAYPTNYTGNQITSANVSSAGRGAIASRELAAASDDPGTFTIPSDQWWAGTVVVRPSAGGGNSAPNAPSQDAPANGATDQSVTPVFTMTATDADSDKLQYKATIYSDVACTSVVQTNNQSSSQTGWSGQNTTCVSGSDCYTSGTQGTFTTQSSLSNGTTYYWEASAKDPLGTNTFTDSATCNSFTTITAPAGTWTTDSGTWSIVSNALTVAPSAGTYNQLHVTSESRTDAVVDVRAKASITGSGDAGSVLRADASANRYQIGNLDFGNTLHRIRKVVATVATTLTSTAFSPSGNTYYQLRASLSGSSLASWINGGTALSTTDSSLSSAGFVGLGAYRSGSAVTFTYDDFAVYTGSTITLNDLPAGGSWSVLDSASAVISCRTGSTWDSSTYTGQVPIDHTGGGGKIAVWEDDDTCSGAADVVYPSNGLASDIFGGDTYSYAAAGSGSAATATSGITISPGGLISY